MQCIGCIGCTLYTTIHCITHWVKRNCHQLQWWKWKPQPQNAKIPKTKRFAMCIDDSHAQIQYRKIQYTEPCESEGVWVNVHFEWNVVEWTCPPHVNTNTRATQKRNIVGWTGHLRKCDFDSQRHFSTTKPATKCPIPTGWTDLLIHRAKV